MFTMNSARRHQHKRELRAAILAAARQIFVRDGYESFSMRKLAAKIECSPGNIYLHFRNKEELFQCLVDESFARLLHTLSRLKSAGMRKNGPDPVELLRKGMHTYVLFGLRNPNDYRFAFLIGPPVTARPYKVHSAFDAMRQMVGRCVAEKYFRAVDAETASQALWAAIHGITSLLIQRPAFPWVSKREVTARVIDSALDSLLAPPIAGARKGAYRVHHRNHRRS
jgi:AcrR family transcriptional regulator